MDDVFLKLPDVLRDILKSQNITKPTEIQEKAIPLALDNKSVLGIAKTGTGKTLAYVLPILARIYKEPRSFYALVLAPSYELAYQIHNVFKIFDSIGFQTVLLRGNEPFSVYQLGLARSPHIVVGCPGRVLDHIANTRGFRPKRFKVLVLDECDKMLSTSLEASMNEIVKRLSPDRQTLLFSATFGERVRKLSEICRSKCEILRLGQDGVLTADNLVQKLVISTFSNKMDCLVYLLYKHQSRCIVFAEYQNTVERIYFTLKALGMSVSYIHGKVTGQVRHEQWMQFETGASKMLVATLECGRGLDIEDLPLVVVYDVPTPEQYTHAVGRAARAGRGGLSLLIALAQDYAKLHILEEYIGIRLDVEKCDQTAIEANHPIVQAAVQQYKYEKKNLDKQKKYQ